MGGHRFDPTILREYDIRGLVGDTLTEADARALGRAFGTLVVESGGRRVAVGRDGRESSPAFEANLVEGLVACGLTVDRVGCGPTPMLYFATYDLPADAGIMVTGSHNPPAYNGFKMILGKRPVYGDAIQRLGRIAADAAWAGTGAAGSATVQAMEGRYVDRLLRDCRSRDDLTIAWDPGNGAAGRVVDALTTRLAGRHVTLNTEIDGRFPNHHPDPTVEANLAQLKEAVATGGCDFGVAFDGDGDRIGVIDGKGRVLWGDQILALLAEDVLTRHPGATIIADVKASQVLFDEVERMGGRPEMWRTGHSLIKQRMADTGAPLAGEMSGHIFFADGWYGFDDGIYTAVRLIDIVARKGIDLAAFRDGLPAVENTPEVRFEVPEARKFAIIEEVKARLASDGADVIDVDGVRVRTADGWWLLRASNTQNVLVARCESADAAGLARLKEAVVAALESSGVQAPAF